MQGTVVRLYLLVSLLAVGLLCGIAGATPTTYYWISPNGDALCDWIPSLGPPNWEMVCEHDSGDYSTYVFVEGDTHESPVVDSYSVCLRDDLLNPWPAGGFNTYNMARMGTLLRDFPQPVTSSSRFEGTYYDWNDADRTDISANIGPPGWQNRYGPIYEFQSGTYATSPTSWDLTQEAKLSGHYISIGATQPGGMTSCSEVWVKVWNRDANWPATAEPASGAVKYFFPSSDLTAEWTPSSGSSHWNLVSDHGGWGGPSDGYVSTTSATFVTDEYALSTDIPDWDTSSYNRMQLIAVINTNDPIGGPARPASFRGTYTWGGGSPSHNAPHDMVDLNLVSFSTRGSWRTYRGPIVRFDAPTDPWIPTYSPIQKLKIEGRVLNGGRLSCDEVYVRLWKVGS